MAHGDVQTVVLTRAQHVQQLPNGLAPRVGPIQFDGVQIAEDGLHLLRRTTPLIELHGGELQLIPGVRAQARGIVVLAQRGVGGGAYGHQIADCGKDRRGAVTHECLMQRHSPGIGASPSTRDR